ncbi:hypothetical protein LTR84_003366 [Exophiala bonariae]|uniref:Clr5 domain-containing protein n=1 Tax=Exophiala bonariae TaxID=1690606 RepID=A0AAV9NAG1_9EURO|nr:hypothetical protein LTR84_003366 [Exophiala bonariae]
MIYVVKQRPKPVPSTDQHSIPIRDQRKAESIPEKSRPHEMDRLDDLGAPPAGGSRPRDERHDWMRVVERSSSRITDVFHPLKHDKRYEAEKAFYAEEDACKSRRGNFQTTFNMATGTDFTIHLDLTVYKDYDKQLEALSYLRRSGQFRAAKEYINTVFGDHLSHPYVFLQYAELLLDMGDYKSFKQLDLSNPFGEKLNSSPDLVLPRQSGTVRHFYPRPGGRIRKSNLHTSQQEGRRTDSHYPSTHEEIWSAPLVDPPEDRSGQGQSRHDGHHLLRWNWTLLRALSQVHLTGKINEALGRAQFVLDNLVIGSEVGSTEIQVISLAFQIFGLVELWLPDIFNIEIRDTLKVWAKWPELYRMLLAQGRVWDFRDIFLSTIGVFGVEWTCLAFFSGSPWREAILDNWVLYERDQSTTLAQLDILTNMPLNLNLPTQGFGQMEWLQRDSQTLAELIMNNYPNSMNSRPFLKWLVIKAATAPLFQQPDVDEKVLNPRYMFDDWPGISMASPDWLSLPIYVPMRNEIPPWDRPEILEPANEPIRVALKMATQLHDHALEVLCLKVLILRSQQPRKLFEQLCQLQETTQEDNEGYLSTCLSRYVIDRDKQSQKRLLFELKQLDDWVSEYDLRRPFTYLAKTEIQDALTYIIKGRDYVAPPERFHMNYYPWLSDRTRSSIRNNSSPYISYSQPPRRARGNTRLGNLPPAVAVEDHGKGQHATPADSAKKANLAQFLGGERRKERRQTEDVEVMEVIEEHDDGLKLRRAASRDRDRQRRSRSRRREANPTENPPLSPTDSDSSDSSSESDDGAENFLAFFPHIPTSLAIDLSGRNIRGKRIVMEIRDAETDEKTVDVNWVRNEDEVTLTMFRKNKGTFTLKKEAKDSKEQWVERRYHLGRRQRKGRGKGKAARRRHRHSSSPSSTSYYSYYSDDADSEGNRSSESESRRIQSGKAKDRGRGVEKRTRERRRKDGLTIVESSPDSAAQPTKSGLGPDAIAKSTGEADPEAEPEADAQAGVEAEREGVEEDNEAGPSTASPEAGQVTGVETEPEVGDEDV